MRPATSFDGYRAQFDAKRMSPDVRKIVGDALTQHITMVGDRCLEEALATTGVTVKGDPYSRLKNTKNGGQGDDDYFWSFLYWLRLSEPGHPAVGSIERLLKPRAGFASLSLQPHLTLPNDDERLNWLHPAAGALRFTGRQAELNSLEQFLSAPTPFLIWGITGPSGAGKTRLALEWIRSTGLTRQRQRPLNAGFLTREGLAKWQAQGGNWQDWAPENPTVIVADYLHNFAGDIGTLIQARAKPQKEGYAWSPVRLLLIDHALPSNLYEVFREPRFGNLPRALLDVVPAMMFRAEPLNMTAPSSQATVVRAVMKSAVEKHGGEADADRLDAAVNELKNIKGAFTPLFAALRGRALAQKATVIFHDRRDLLHQYLDTDDRLPWRTTPEYPQHGFLAGAAVIAASAVRGLDFDEINRQLPASADARPTDFSRIQTLARWVSSSSNRTTLNAFVPDLLSEALFTVFLRDAAATYPDGLDVLTSLLSCGRDDEERNRRAFNLSAFARRCALNFSQEAIDTIESDWEAALSFFAPSRFASGTPARDAGTVANVQLGWPLLEMDVEKETPAWHAAGRLIQTFGATLPRLAPELLQAATGPLAEYILEGATVLARRSGWHPQFAQVVYVAVHAEALIRELAGEEPETPLVRAIRRDLEPVAHAICVIHPNEVHTPRPSDGVTPLMLASRKGMVGLVDTMLRIPSINVMAPAKNGKTALYFAVMGGHLDIANAILDHPSMDREWAARFHRSRP